MPKIQWDALPPTIRDHLLDRAREREVSFDDLYQLKLWRESSPDAPDGPCTRTLALSNYAARASIRRLFFSLDKLQRDRELTEPPPAHLLTGDESNGIRDCVPAPLL